MKKFAVILQLLFLISALSACAFQRGNGDNVSSASAVSGVTEAQAPEISADPEYEEEQDFDGEDDTREEKSPASEKETEETAEKKAETASGDGIEKNIGETESARAETDREWFT